MAESEHGRIIAAQAGAILKPLGFRRKGRSRTWLADEGFWANVIEFQPFSYSRGCYVNVAVHWLWAALPGVISLDRPDRVPDAAEFENADQFNRALSELAPAAAEIAMDNRARFSTIRRTAALLVEEERTQMLRPGSWSRYHAGIAAGLVGMNDVAQKILESVGDPRVLKRTQDLLPALREPETFTARVSERVAAQRHQLRFEPRAWPPGTISTE